MTDKPRIVFAHIGLFVNDLAGMERFYTGFMGFTVTDRGHLSDLELVFLSADPDEHHQIVLASGRPAQLPFNVINQLSFRVDSLTDLKTLYGQLAEQPVSEIAPVTHGNAWSVYFRDPEGNRVELYTHTPWYVHQPLREPLDLALPEAEIRRRTEALCRELPGFTTRSVWRERVEGLMRENG